jgi:hypothetical protein
VKGRSFTWPPFQGLGKRQALDTAAQNGAQSGVMLIWYALIAPVANGVRTAAQRFRQFSRATCLLDKV